MANYNNSKTSSKSQSPTYNRRNTMSLMNAAIEKPGDISPAPRPASAAQQTYPDNPLLPGDSSRLVREAFNRKQFDDTIDTSFSQLGIPVEADRSTFDPSLATVGDFFTIYQSLFYSIPKEGSINSHQFLIDQSTEYTQYVAQQAEIDELLEEINELRAQNLELVNDVILATEAISNLETNLNG